MYFHSIPGLVVQALKTLLYLSGSCLAKGQPYLYVLYLLSVATSFASCRAFLGASSSSPPLRRRLLLPERAKLVDFVESGLLLRLELPAELVFLPFLPRSSTIGSTFTVSHLMPARRSRMLTPGKPQHWPSPWSSIAGDVSMAEILDCSEMGVDACECAETRCELLDQLVQMFSGIISRRQVISQDARRPRNSLPRHGWLCRNSRGRRSSEIRSQLGINL